MAWRFEYEREPGLPPLAWLAHVSAGVVRVRCGSSARLQAQRRSWINLEPRLGSLLLRWAISIVGARYRDGYPDSDPTLRS